MSKEIKEQWIKVLLEDEKSEKKKEKWGSYYYKEYSDVVKINGDYFFPVRKSTLETRFCFGHGLNGVTTQEEQTSAINQAQHARTSEDYFRKENMDAINRKISVLELYIKSKDLEEFRNKLETLNLSRYDYDGEPFIYFSNRKHLTIDYSFCNKLNPNFRYYSDAYIREANKNDLKLILEALKGERDKFEKRINTYLKKYGTSKVKAWSYLVD